MTSGGPISPPIATSAPPKRGAFRGRAALPIAWVLLLLFAPSWPPLQQRRSEHALLDSQLKTKQATLDELRALAVAARIEGRESNALQDEFATLTGLRASDPFRDPAHEEPASIQVAALVRAVQEASSKEVGPDDPAPITLLSVTPGARQQLGPFLMTEFELNLVGRFRAIPAFLDLLTQVGHNRRLAISVGSLKLSSQADTQETGALSITLPVRAYFRE